MSDREQLVNQVIETVQSALQMGNTISEFSEDTRLLGDLPELDSMTVLTLITHVEEYFGFTLDDDEIDAEMFESIRSLTNFVESKLRKLN
jgi:acyl carrier protein